MTRIRYPSARVGCHVSFSGSKTANCDDLAIAYCPTLDPSYDCVFGKNKHKAVDTLVLLGNTPLRFELGLLKAYATRAPWHPTIQPVQRRKGKDETSRMNQFAIYHAPQLHCLSVLFCCAYIGNFIGRVHGLGTSTGNWRQSNTFGSFLGYSVCLSFNSATYSACFELEFSWLTREAA